MHTYRRVCVCVSVYHTYIHTNILDTYIHMACIHTYEHNRYIHTYIHTYIPQIFGHPQRDHSAIIARASSSGENVHRDMNRDSHTPTPVMGGVGLVLSVTAAGKHMVEFLAEHGIIHVYICVCVLYYIYACVCICMCVYIYICIC